MGKVIKSGKGDFAKGGKGHMFGKQHAGQQASGTTAHQPTSDGKFASGGKTKMFGKQSADTMVSGQTSKKG